MGMSLVFMFFSAGVCILGPIAVAVILIKKFKASWMMFALGIVSFTVSQLLLRVPIFDELNKTAWFSSFAEAQQILYPLLIALSMGVFEEAGRYVALRFLNRGLLTWENGVIFALGHGGMEAFWGMGLISIDLIAKTLSGSFNDPSISAFMLFGGTERVFAMAMHIGFTMFVLYAVKRRNIWYFMLAIALHTIVDIAGFMIPVTGEILNFLIAQGVYAVFAAAAIIVTVKMRPPLNTEQQKV